MRAGRLDRHIQIPLPDEKGREGILRWHLQELLHDADLSGIAAKTEGWNGASLEQLVRQARRLARRQRRALVLDDLTAELPAEFALPRKFGVEPQSMKLGMPSSRWFSRPGKSSLSQSRAPSLLCPACRMAAG